MTLGLACSSTLLTTRFITEVHAKERVVRLTDQCVFLVQLHESLARDNPLGQK